MNFYWNIVTLPSCVSFYLQQNESTIYISLSINLLIFLLCILKYLLFGFLKDRLVKPVRRNPNQTCQTHTKFQPEQSRVEQDLRHSLILKKKSESLSCSVMSDSLRTHALQPTRLPCPWKFSRSGLPFPSPGDISNPGLNPSLLNWRQIPYHLSHQGSLSLIWPYDQMAIPHLQVLRPKTLEPSFFPLFQSHSIFNLSVNSLGSKLQNTTFLTTTLFQANSLSHLDDFQSHLASLPLCSCLALVWSQQDSRVIF